MNSLEVNLIYFLKNITNAFVIFALSFAALLARQYYVKTVEDGFLSQPISFRDDGSAYCLDFIAANAKLTLEIKCQNLLLEHADTQRFTDIELFV